MIVGLDGRAANEPKRAGIGNYCLELLRAMQTLGGARFRVYLDRAARAGFPVDETNTEIRILPPGRFWTQRILAAELRHHPPDVFLSPGLQLPIACRCPRVATVLDLAYFDYGGYFTWRARTRARIYTRTAACVATHWLAISQATAADMTAQLGIPASRITVTPLGVSATFRPGADTAQCRFIREKYRLVAPYLLYLGRIQPRKNLVRLMEAFAALRAGRSDLPHELIIAGDEGWLTSGIYEAARCSPAHDAIRFLGFVPEEDLPGLISCADALALVSLWEGFGLPVLEAMACGTPVIASNCSSLPEVAGEAAVLVDPFDISSIRNGLERLLADASLRADLSAKGIARSRLFSWENTARLTLQALGKVVE
ncbi:MAG TPA: glycosyltransferase family 1 protein [Candidatus Hydrogenedentes bacterium]|nr:glycosyltransferase family 1 protein [Candidatus Hydrogenedentota bacterium]